MIAAREEGGSGKHKIIVPEAKCGLTTTEDKEVEAAPAGPVGVEAQWVPLNNRTEVPLSGLQMWENFLAGKEVFVEAEGQRLPGPNYSPFGEYPASKEDIL